MANLTNTNLSMVTSSAQIDDYLMVTEGLTVKEQSSFLFQSCRSQSWRHIPRVKDAEDRRPLCCLKVNRSVPRSGLDQKRGRTWERFGGPRTQLQRLMILLQREDHVPLPTLCRRWLLKPGNSQRVNRWIHQAPPPLAGKCSEVATAQCREITCLPKITTYRTFGSGLRPHRVSSWDV